MLIEYLFEMFPNGEVNDQAIGDLEVSGEILNTIWSFKILWFYVRSFLLHFEFEACNMHILYHIWQWAEPVAQELGSCSPRELGLLLVGNRLGPLPPLLYDLSNDCYNRSN